MTTHLPLNIHSLPKTLPQEGSICIELAEGIPIFRASEKVHTRIEILLEKEKKSLLNPEEAKELNEYEELDDYLSLVNRLVRNIYLNQN
ncbi:MAG: hypothetical protein F6K14_13080 [Symploca sp. SIO2C1]|nr:hypothetical protein [Symploca sp. SIO2C1]